MLLFTSLFLKHKGRFQYHNVVQYADSKNEMFIAIRSDWATVLLKALGISEILWYKEVHFPYLVIQCLKNVWSSLTFTTTGKYNGSLHKMEASTKLPRHG
jgi:hypothetical protein